MQNKKLLLLLRRANVPAVPAAPAAGADAACAAITDFPETVATIDDFPETVATVLDFPEALLAITDEGCGMTTTPYNFYDTGDLIITTATFTGYESGLPVDPTNVFLHLKDPSGNVTTIQYGVGAITKVSTGVYRAEIDLDEAGDWWYGWQGTGDWQTREEKRIHARALNAVAP